MTLLAAIAIVLADWGTACAHMAYTVGRSKGDWWVGPTRLPFYDHAHEVPVHWQRCTGV